MQREVHSSFELGTNTAFVFPRRHIPEDATEGSKASQGDIILKCRQLDPKDSPAPRRHLRVVADTIINNIIYIEP